MEEEKKPKIDLVIGILVLVFVVVLDLIDLIPFAGDVTDIVALPIYFYLQTVGVSGVVFLISEFLDLFPVIQEFPLRTIGWLITWGIDAFAPKSVSGALEQAGELAQAGEGGAVEGEGTTVAKEGAAATTATAEQGAMEVTQEAGVVTAETAAEAERAGGGAASPTAGEGREGFGEESGGEAENPSGEPGEGDQGQPEIEPEALGEQRDVLGEKGELQKELLEETPTAPTAESAETAAEPAPEQKQSRFERMKQRVQDIREYLPDVGQGTADDNGDMDKDDGLGQAA